MTTVVRSESPLPYRLRRLEDERGLSAVALVADAIAKTPTLDDAARSLGVSRMTLYEWRIRLGLAVGVRPSAPDD